MPVLEVSITEAGVGALPFRDRPYAHVSIEVGHLHLDDAVSEKDIAALFERTAPWFRAVRDAWQGLLGSYPLRFSTAILLDDYFGAAGALAPHSFLELVSSSCEEHLGVPLDYVARESSFAESVAPVVESMIQPQPPEGTDGSRAPLAETGWLANGKPSVDHAQVVNAMAPATAWQPPVQNGSYRHSIFLDVELRKKDESRAGGTLWSCPLLAAVWQLVRLGLLRDAEGNEVIKPVAWSGESFDSWTTVPAILALGTHTAQPFVGYWTTSILDTHFLPIEHAVRSILDQTEIDEQVLKEAPKKAAKERLPLEAAVTERVSYAFVPAFGGRR